MTTFAERLKNAMEQANMSQSALSEQAGASKAAISQYLSGKNIPKDAVKQKLAEALETSVDFLDGKNVSSDVNSAGEALKNVPVEQAAKMLGKSKQFVRVALQRGIAPFGFAVKVSGDKWSYHISPRKLNEYLGVAS